MQAARAKPDGYTLLLNHIGMSTIPLLYKKLNFDPLTAYEFIGLFAEAREVVILARKDFAPRDLWELVAYAKANREKLTMASSRARRQRHAIPPPCCSRRAIGVQITQGAVQGRRPRGGRCALGSGRSLVRPADHDVEPDPQRRPARLCADGAQAHDLAARRADSGRSRHASALHGSVVRALCAWASTPPPVLEVLNAALRSTKCRDETVAAQLEKIETYLLPLDQATPEALRQKLSSQIELWRPIIEKAGLQAE